MRRLGSRPRPAATASTEAFGDEVVVYCERTQRMHCLDLRASVVWAACDGDRDVSAVVDEVAGVFAVEPAAIHAEVEATLGQFHALGILR